MGVAQGSIPSPALFSININNIVQSVLKGPDSLYVDGFALCIRGRSVQTMGRTMESCVNSVHNWVFENGFTFSHFTFYVCTFAGRMGFFPNLLSYWTTPIKPSLSSRHLKLSLTYVIKLNSCPTNPVNSCF